MTTRCLISFGANLGVPAHTIAQAVALLESHLSDQLSSLKLSRLFRTPAVGGPSGQPPFINAVAALEVKSISPWDLWHIVREIEHTLGRVRQERWEARRIDLDILMVDQHRIWTQHFKLPHPRMIMRRFILEPALDVAADWIEPVSGWTIAQLTKSLRAGPASIALVSFNPAVDQRLMEQAAVASQCQWVTPTLCAEGQSRAEQSAHRWLGLIFAESIMPAKVMHLRPTETPVSDGSVRIQPRPQLVIVLAPTITKPGAAWEDIHRDLARWMRMCPSDQAPLWPLTGARYLLATDDRQWAEHELVAALEAMDCPVEPIEG